MASCALGKAIRDLGRHWQQCWGYRPVFLETFVDPQYFEGTCYRAANFRYLGMTRGMGLIRQGQSYATNPKKIKHKLSTLMICGMLMFVFQMSSCREANREMSRPLFWRNLQFFFPELERTASLMPFTDWPDG